MRIMCGLLHSWEKEIIFSRFSDRKVYIVLLELGKTRGIHNAIRFKFATSQ